MNVLLHIATLVVLICSVGSINICSHGAYINTDRQYMQLNYELVTDIMIFEHDEAQRISAML